MFATLQKVHECTNISDTCWEFTPKPLFNHKTKKPNSSLLRIFSKIAMQGMKTYKRRLPVTFCNE